MPVKDVAVLREMLDTGKVEDLSGRKHDIHSQVKPDFAEALHQAVLKHRPKTVVEVGMAYGVSAIAILSALEAAGDGRLISVDPFQGTQWQGIGRANVERAGLAARHTLVEEFDYLALPRLLGEGLQADFAYIDWQHTFDYVVLDAFYLDKMLRPGGVLGFNDCVYRSVHRALKWLTTHRHYRELDVGLTPDYKGANPLRTLIRRLDGRGDVDRYFEKLDSWEPEYNYYRPF